MDKQVDYKKLYEQYKEDYEETKREYDEYKGTSDEIQTELEAQLEEGDRKNAQLVRQVDELKETMKKQRAQAEEQMSRLERELQRYKNDLTVFEEKDQISQKLKVDLENDNDLLLSKNRMLETMITDLENKLDKLIEELAIVHTELDENKNSSQERIERLKQQLQDMEHELYAVKVSNQKKIAVLENNSLQNQDNKDAVEPPITQDVQPENQRAEQSPELQLKENTVDNSIVSNVEGLIDQKKENEHQKQNGTLQEDYKTQAEEKKKILLESKVNNCNENIYQLRINNHGFKKSLNLVSSLIQELDDKMNEIRSQRHRNMLDRSSKQNKNNLSEITKS